MATRKVTLYLYPGASSLFPHILLNQAGITYTPKVIDIFSKAPGNEYAAINPKQLVPALDIDGDIVTENPAIAQAINQLAPEKQILGKDPKQYLRVCEWLNWIAGPFHAQAWAPLVRPQRFTTDPNAESSIREKSKEKVLGCYDRIESSLSEGGWALGDNFTAVDAYLLPFWYMCKFRVRDDAGQAYPKWSKLMAKLLELDSVKKTLQAEQALKKELGA